MSWEDRKRADRLATHLEGAADFIDTIADMISGPDSMLSSIIRSLPEEYRKAVRIYRAEVELDDLQMDAWCNAEQDAEDAARREDG